MKMEKIHELRKDPVVGRWVIISEEERKIHWREESAFPPKEEVSPKCPFCPGNEDKTPPEILSYRQAGTRANTPGWWLRVIPNRFPALAPEGEPQRTGEGMYDLMKGVGAHEVIIENDRHHKTLSDLEEKMVEEVLWSYRDRSLALKQDPRIKYVLIFKNWGRSAGASLEHSHSQIIATPVVPRRILDELRGARQYYDFKERCVFCDIIYQEQNFAQRIIVEDENTICLAPFASRFPYKCWIFPKKHASSFETIEKWEIISLARVLKETLARLAKLLQYPPYNFTLLTAPCREPPLEHYHWHIEIFPHLIETGGFEWGTGFYVNPIPPEEAARKLRAVKI